MPQTRIDDEKQMLVLNAGMQVLKDKPAEAIEQYFDKVIAFYETNYASAHRTTFCARNAAESLVYLLLASQTRKNAIVLGRTWCDAYHLRGYALVELGRYAQARESFEKAIAMAPQSAEYAVELGSLDSRERKWPEALERYEKAARFAREITPDENKNRDLGRALRGKAYVLVELGRLEEAEALYKQCLEMNSADIAARNELQYVQSVRQQQKPQ